MIEKKNRLIKIARINATYDAFKAHATKKPRWYFSPWINAGNAITESWLKTFYSTVTGREVIS